MISPGVSNLLLLPFDKLDTNCWKGVVFCWYMWVTNGEDNLNMPLIDSKIILSEDKLINMSTKNELIHIIGDLMHNLG